MPRPARVIYPRKLPSPSRSLYFRVSDTMSVAESSTIGSEHESRVDEGVAKTTSQIVADVEKRDPVDSMLSVIFSTPLAGQPRAEKIKQMSKNHVSHLVKLCSLPRPNMSLTRFSKDCV